MTVRQQKGSEVQQSTIILYRVWKDAAKIIPYLIGEKQTKIDGYELKNDRKLFRVISKSAKFELSMLLFEKMAIVKKSRTNRKWTYFWSFGNTKSCVAL